MKKANMPNESHMVDSQIDWVEYRKWQAKTDKIITYSAVVFWFFIAGVMTYGFNPSPATVIGYVGIFIASLIASFMWVGVIALLFGLIAAF